MHVTTYTHSGWQVTLQQLDLSLDSGVEAPGLRGLQHGEAEAVRGGRRLQQAEALAHFRLGLHVAFSCC